MSVESRWIRLNVDYLRTPWLDALGYPYNHLWADVLTYVKETGNNRGSCKAVTTNFFGRFTGAPPDHVQLLLDAATEAGALVIEDDKWTVVNWHSYQSTDAERKRAERDELSRTNTESPGQTAIVTDKAKLSRTTEECHGQDRTTLDTLSRDHDSDNYIDRTSNLRERVGDVLPPPPPPTPNFKIEAEKAWLRFFETFPRRSGHNGKSLGREKFLKLIASGVNPEAVIAGAAAYRDSAEAKGEIGTEFVCQIPTWLNQKRWQDDYLPTQPRGQPQGGHTPNKITTENPQVRT